MGDSKIINRFQRLVEECDKAHIFSGTILDFDTVDYVPKERLTKGMLVTSKAGTRRVSFTAQTINKPIVNATSLQINEPVQVFGVEAASRPNTTIPVIIAVPERRLVLFAKERDMFSWKGGPADYIQALSYLIGITLLAISQLAPLLPLASPLNILQSLAISLQVGLISGVFLLIMLGIDWYRSYLTRFRLVHCDSETWDTISSFMPF